MCFLRCHATLLYQSPECRIVQVVDVCYYLVTMSVMPFINWKSLGTLPTVRLPPFEVVYNLLPTRILHDAVSTDGMQKSDGYMIADVIDILSTGHRSLVPHHPLAREYLGRIGSTVRRMKP